MNYGRLDVQMIAIQHGKNICGRRVKDAQSKEERVHKVFEKIYDNYDKMNSVISFQKHMKWRKDTMKRWMFKKESKALDVCCGTGDWTIALAEAVGPEGEVIGLRF